VHLPLSFEKEETEPWPSGSLDRPSSVEQTLHKLICSGIVTEKKRNCHEEGPAFSRYVVLVSFCP
jgi:hypothetical protein